MSELIEPSDQERAELPEATAAYLEALEQEIEQLRTQQAGEAVGYANGRMGTFTYRDLYDQIDPDPDDFAVFAHPPAPVVPERMTYKRASSEFSVKVNFTSCRAATEFEKFIKAAQRPSAAGCSKADKFEAAKAAYIRLTNNQDSIDPDNGKFYYSADREIMGALHNFFMGNLEHQTHPPAPVVPERMTYKRASSEFIKDDPERRKLVQFVYGWNACREAMLKSAQGSE